MADKRKPRILNVDDNDAARYAVTRILRKAGFDVVEAATGEEALRRIEERPDLVLLDVNLPDINGFEVCKRIKANPQRVHIPVVHLSATFVGSEDRTRGLEDGADGYLTQPVEPKVLVATINAFLRLKTVERSLRESVEKYRLLVEYANDAIFVAQDEVIKFPNPVVMKLTGYSEEELMAIPFMNLIHPDDRELVLERYRKRLMGEAVPTLYAFRMIDKEGRESWVQLNAVRITWEGRPATLNFLRDITEQRTLEVQLQQSQKMEALGNLAGGLAHDLNNLMTVVMGYSNLLLTVFDKDKVVRKDLEEIRKAGERAADLVRQLLAFTRRQVLKPVRMDLNGVVKGMDRMLRRLIGEDIDLQTVLSAGLGQVKADPSQIEQVIMNLVVNAKDAMPQGGKLTIETNNITLDEAYGLGRGVQIQAGLYVMVSVCDTGTGIDKETQTHIFEPFFSTKEKGKGTGLGLSTVYGIVKQHGGYVWTYSELGEGTTFKVYLPRVEGEPDVASVKQVGEGVLQGTETILVVEDEEVVMRLARKVLEGYGYTVLAAGSGEEALEICMRDTPPIHLMLTDVVMPGLSGRQLADRVKTHRADMKVLYMSGYTDNAIVHHGVLEKDVNFIEKPFTPKGLAGKVREVLGD